MKKMVFLFICLFIISGLTGCSTGHSKSTDIKTQLKSTPEDYLTTMGRLNANLDNTLNQFNKLVTKPQIAKPSWQKQIQVVVATYKMLSEKVRQIEPPAKYKDFHILYKSALDEYDRAVDQFTSPASFAFNRQDILMHLKTANNNKHDAIQVIRSKSVEP